MKTVSLSLILFFLGAVGVSTINTLATPISDKKKDGDTDITLFAVASLPQGQSEVYLGDSVVVNITVYSNTNFEQITPHTDKQPSVKRATTRRYHAGRRLSQDVAAYKGKRYYAVVAEQYVVTPSELGELTFPARDYDVVLSVQLRSQRSNPFDPFGSFFPFGRTESRQIKKDCSSSPLKIKVAKRPRKTIQELQQSGATVM